MESWAMAMARARAEIGKLDIADVMTMFLQAVTRFLIVERVGGNAKMMDARAAWLAEEALPHTPPSASEARDYMSAPGL
jgi:hypothetical protein